VRRLIIKLGPRSSSLALPHRARLWQPASSAQRWRGRRNFLFGPCFFDRASPVQMIRNVKLDEK
jgi:hypothetical protein